MLLMRGINLYNSQSYQKKLFSFKSLPIYRTLIMEGQGKRQHEDNEETCKEQPEVKSIKTPNNESNTRFANLFYNNHRPISQKVLDNLTPEDIKLLEEVKSSCTDLDKIRQALNLRIKHRLSIRLPDDLTDSSYYVEDGLRRVYPYPYLYQAHAKRRWFGRKLIDVLKQEFRDISDEQLKLRFATGMILVNGEVLSNYNHTIKDNDFILNRCHRHELPVLATPIKIIHQDKDTLVINKPPSVPIHPCGRYRYNSVINILATEYNMKNVKVVHRLDRLVSGVLIFALNSTRANALETLIRNRDVQKEYVCRVAGEFPIGEITVDQPLETIPGKIGITVVLPEGKPSVTSFKRLNYNGKTSAVLCKPLTGRTHQIRVHLQYLGHPIVNDGLYNCTSFGPERGKGGRYGGKSLQKLSDDVISKHRASTWLISEDNDHDMIVQSNEESTVEAEETPIKIEDATKVAQFISDEEREETMAALAHFFTNESWRDLEQKKRYDPKKFVTDPECRDCKGKFHDPPPRSLYLYLHALKYSGSGWCYESEMPAWAADSWKY